MFSYKNEVFYIFLIVWLIGNIVSLVLELCKCIVFELGWVFVVFVNFS